MHAGIDGSIWGRDERGVAAATRRLALEVIRTHGGEDRFTMFLPRGAAGPALSPEVEHRASLVEVAEMGPARRVLWQQLRLDGLARKHAVDVLYCPSYTAPLQGRVPQVLTVHDLIAWKRPDLCRWRNVLHFRTLVPWSTQRARYITVPTESVKRDLIEYLDVREEKIVVIPWGVDLEIVPVDRDEAREIVRRGFGLSEPFVLFAGALEPKKNIATLIAAVDRLPARLVLVGPRGWGESRLRRRLMDVAAEHGPRHLGFVPTEMMGPLYSAASAFAFPSHIEGFGLPVLEAMACGTPVVASEAPAIVEVAGGAALHVPAADAGALAAGLKQVLTDSSLRDSMATMGRARAAEFTWSRAARMFRDVLEMAAGASAIP